jgi:acyl carrier protein
VSADIVKEIQGYVLSEFAAERDEIAPDENLLGQGILDSMGILKLVTFLEERFGIQTVDDDLVPENFESIAHMRDFVERKRSG